MVLNVCVLEAASYLEMVKRERLFLSGKELGLFSRWSFVAGVDNLFFPSGVTFPLLALLIPTGSSQVTVWLL